MLKPAALGAALALAGTVSGCTSKESREAAGSTAAESPRTVTVTATDFAFEAPAQVPAGATKVHLVNQGKELHQAQLVKLEDGKTVADLVQALNTQGPPPKWIKFVGGPNGIAPGQETSATSVLTPGQYAYLCWIPSPSDGKLHVSKGMVRAFEVTDAASGAPKELPPSDVTITLKDYDFETSEPLKPGRHTIKVENAGPQPHELVLLRMAPGKKAEDFVHWFEGGAKGPPPAEALGGVVNLDQGAEATFTADLTAGDYGLICFVPDSKDGKMHLAHGMIKTIRVG